MCWISQLWRLNTNSQCLFKSWFYVFVCLYLAVTYHHNMSSPSIDQQKVPLKIELPDLAKRKKKTQKHSVKFTFHIHNIFSISVSHVITQEIFTLKIFVVYLKFNFNWKSYTFSDNPFLQPYGCFYSWSNTSFLQIEAATPKLEVCIYVNILVTLGSQLKEIKAHQTLLSLFLIKDWRTTNQNNLIYFALYHKDTAYV